MKSVILSTCLVGLFISCTPQTQKPSVKKIASKIIGGTKVALNHFNQTVALTLETHAPNSLSQFCSGTVINSHTVITAAHCLARLTSEERARLTVHVGEGSDQNYVGEYPVDQVRVHPDFLEIDNADFTRDIAYVTIKDHFKGINSFPTVMKPEQIDKIINKDTVTIVGFGTRENDHRGTKYKTNTYLISRDSSYATTKSDMHDACHGDSGGSLYYQQGHKLYFIGITSHSAAALGSPDSKCGMSTNYVLASVAVDWYREDIIAQQIELLNKEGKYTQAIAKAMQVVTPQSSSFYAALYSSYLGLKDYKQALATLNRSLEQNPRSLAIQMKKIDLLHRKLKDHQQAKELVLNLLMHNPTNKTLLKYTEEFNYPEDQIAYALGQGSLYDNHLGFNIRLVRSAREYFEKAYKLNRSNQNYLWYLNALVLENTLNTEQLISMISEAPFDYTFISKQHDPAGADSRYYAFKSRNARYLHALLQKFPEYKKIIHKNINEFLLDAITSYGSKVFDYLLTHFAQNKINYKQIVNTIITSPDQEMITVLSKHHIFFSQFFTQEQLEERIYSLFENNYFNVATSLLSTEKNLQSFTFKLGEVEKYFNRAVDYNDFQAANFFIQEYKKILTPTNKQLTAIIENAILTYSDDPILLQNVVSEFPFSQWEAKGIFDNDMTLLEMIIEEENSDLATFILNHAKLKKQQRDELLAKMTTF